MKTIFLSAIITGLLITAGALADSKLFRKYRQIPDLSIRSYEPGMSSEIYSGKPAVQEFISTFNGLNRILIPLEAEKGIDSIEIVFRLKKDINSQKDIATCAILADDIKKNKYQKFSFSDIKDSKGKAFVLMIEAPKAQKADGIKVRITKNECAGFKRYEGSSPAIGIMQLSTFCDYNGTLTGEISNFFNSFISDRPFAIFYFILISGIILTAILLRIGIG